MEKAETKGAAFDFYGKLPLTKAVPLGLQHVLAMFVGNLTPILIITGAAALEQAANLQSCRWICCRTPCWWPGS